MLIIFTECIYVKITLSLIFKEKIPGSLLQSESEFLHPLLVIGHKANIMKGENRDRLTQGTFRIATHPCLSSLTIMSVYQSVFSRKTEANLLHMGLISLPD